MSHDLKQLRRSLFLIYMPMVFILFGLPLRAEDLGASGVEIGVLFSIFTSALLILRPLVGIGLDRIGRRAFFIAAMIFYLFANSLYAVGDTINGLYFARAFHGIGFAILSITTETITADLTQQKNRAEAMGGNIASQSRGGMLGAFIGFSLVGFLPVYAWQYSFAFYGVVAGFAVVFAVRYIPETLPVGRKEKPNTKFKFPRQYYGLLAVIFLAAFASAIIQPYYLIYLRGRLGLELQALAAVFLPMGIAYAIFPGILGRWVSDLNRALVVSAGFVIAAVLYASVPHIGSFIWLIGAFTGAAIGGVLVDLSKNAWLGDIADPEAAGRTFGMGALATGIGATLGPLAGGYIFDNIGKPYIFYAGSAVLLMAALTVSPYAMAGITLKK